MKDEKTTMKKPTKPQTPPVENQPASNEAKPPKTKLNINDILTAADNEKSGKTFHGADKKAEALAAAERKGKNPFGAGRKQKKEEEKAKQFVLYYTSDEREAIEKACSTLGGKSPQKWSNEMLLKMVRVLNSDSMKRTMLIGLLNEGE